MKPVNMLQPDPVYHLKVQNPVHSLDFFNQQLLIGCENGKIKVFCLSSLRSNYELKVSSSPIVFISSDTESLICQDRTGLIKVYDLEKSGYVINTEIQTNHTGFARSIRVKGDKDLLVTPSDTAEINVYDVDNITPESNEPIHKLVPPMEETGQLMCLWETSLSDNSSYLLAGYESGHLIMWDLKDFRHVDHIKYDFPICTIDYDLSSNRGVLSSPEIHKIPIFGIDKSNLELDQRPYEYVELNYDEEKKFPGVSIVRIRPDRKCFVVGCCDGNVDMASWKSLRNLATLKNHRSQITDIAFSPAPIDNFKSNITAVGSADGSVTLWDIYNPKK